MTQRTLDPAQPLTRAQTQIAFERATLVWGWASQVALVVKNLPANAGDIRDVGLIPGSGRSRGGGHGNPLQYSCLGNSMDGGIWLATVHGVAESQT